MKIPFIAMLLAGAFGFGGGAAAQDKTAFPDDAAITARVERAIQADASLKEMDIRVVTEGQVVRLRGFVNTLGDIGRAGVLAQGVRGVLHVRNSLRIANRPSRT